jgi:hypothetical protein
MIRYGYRDLKTREGREASIKTHLAAALKRFPLACRRSEEKAARRLVGKENRAPKGAELEYSD